jgi:PAS domain S-box-containing protein
LRLIAFRAPRPAEDTLQAFDKILLANFLPHGTCYLWNPKIVWLHVTSDAVITLSYYCIPLALVYLAKKRRDIPFNWVFWMFAVFILGCGTTHLMEVWTVWHPTYFLAGLVKAGTATASVVTAVVLVRLLPKAIALPTVEQLYGLNRRLVRQVDSGIRREQELTDVIAALERRVREKTAELESIDKSLEKEIAAGAEAPLRRWALAGTIVALVATGLIGFLCWRSAVKASTDAGWVTHTQEVRNALETTLAHVDDVENGTRAFQVQGEDRFLRQYQEARSAATRDLETLRSLIVDNPVQRGHLDMLESQVNARLEFSRRTIAERQRTGLVPASTIFVEGDRLMDQVRTTLGLMDGIERTLLEKRSRESREARRRTNVSIVIATAATAIFLLIAGSIVTREANHSARLRSQLRSVNAELERGVEQRASALRESEDRFRGVIESAMDAILTIDSEQNIVLFNAAAEKMFDCKSSEAAGKPIERFVPERFRQQHSDHIRRFGEVGVTNRAMGRLMPLSGVRASGEEFPIEASISQVNTNGRKSFTVIIRDITERRKAEQEIRTLNQQLEERVRERTAELEATNKELEAFTYSVSHDLRAPLRHIGGFSKMLAEEAGALLKPEARHYLQRIQEGTNRMGALVDDLLSLTRFGRHEIRVQVTGIESIINDAINELRPDTESRTIEWKIGRLPFVEADPSLLKVVFQNLLSNAVKYTRPRAKAVIEIGSDQIDGQQVIYVRDNGVGFNMKYADKLFGVFQRLHRAEDFEGTGVGLATVQRIIQKHGGRIWAEAELDKGATFYLTVGNATQEKEINRAPAMAAEAR